MARAVEERTVLQESKRLGGFRVPAFQVKIAGAGLANDVVGDVMQVTYRDNIRELDSFELTVGNWDAANRRFKYVGAESSADLQSSEPEGRRYRLFEPCGEEVELWLGYLPDLKLMMRATLTTLEPTFSGAAPTLAARGLNVLHDLRDKPHSDHWVRKRDSDIARNVAQRRRFRSRSGGESIPLRINKSARSQEEPIEFVSQNNQHDIDFLLERARLRGYVVYLDEDERGRFLYFGPSGEDAERQVAFQLEWGRSLLDFKPTLSTAKQVRSVTVRGWDRKKNKAIRETVKYDDSRLRINRDLYRILDACHPREEIVQSYPVFNAAQARSLARSLMSDQLKELVQASGTTVGLPELRAGTLLRIGGVGQRFSGTYFVTETTHTLNERGYMTQFKARREEPGGAA